MLLNEKKKFVKDIQAKNSEMKKLDREIEEQN